MEETFPSLDISGSSSTYSDIENPPQHLLGASQSSELGGDVSTEIYKQHLLGNERPELFRRDSWGEGFVMSAPVAQNTFII